jgi:predicted phage terminase large subunit-like protein
LGYTFFYDEVLCTDTALRCPAADDSVAGTATSDGVTGFEAFATAVMVKWHLKPARHHLMLIDMLQKVAAGSTDRLMVQMPPGSAKSTFASVLFPAYWFACQPRSEIIAACHTASLAEHFGRKLRTLIGDQGAGFGLTLEAGSRAAGRFGLTQGGQYFATGVRGPITGRRADLILIDDPVKTWAEAESHASRDALYDWYRAELLSRLKPNGRVVLIMTRWHEDDLVGRLISHDKDWTILRLPALAEPGDPMGRAVGEALWPDWESAELLTRKCATMGEHIFQAMFQQKPMAGGSLLFDATKLEVTAVPPGVVRTVRAWDLAATASTTGRNPDWTVGLKLGLMADARYVVLDIVRLQGVPTDVEQAVGATARADGVATTIALAQDPGQAGVAQIAHYRRNLHGFNVVSSPETGSKTMRATPASALVGAGRIMVVDASWTNAFVAELQAFPQGAKDDQVDALARALATISQVPAAARAVQYSLMGR